MCVCVCTRARVRVRVRVRVCVFVRVRKNLLGGALCAPYLHTFSTYYKYLQMYYINLYNIIYIYCLCVCVCVCVYRSLLWRKTTSLPSRHNYPHLHSPSPGRCRYTRCCISPGCLPGSGLQHWACRCMRTTHPCRLPAVVYVRTSVCEYFDISPTLSSVAFN